MPKFTVFESTKDLPKFFHEAIRKSINDFKDQDSHIDLKQLGEYIHDQVEVNGNPLVIGDFNTLPSWDRDLFHLNCFLKLYQDTVQVYHMTHRYTESMSTDEFLSGLQQRNVNELPDNDQQEDDNDEIKEPFARYGKDLDCPAVIQQKLQSILPSDILPLDTTDLFVHMPKHLRAENLMCYVGSDGTGTAIHRDICATLGHNLMIYGDDNAFSEWYLITNDERPKLLQAIHKRKSKHGIDATSSTFVETDRAWLARTRIHQEQIKTHVILQRPGDLVLVPSMCYHQVRNINTSIKVAWNRATPRSLQMAVQKQLPIYQQLIRPEVYRCKAMVYRTILSLIDKDNDTSHQVPSMDDDVNAVTTVPRSPDFNPTMTTNDTIIQNTYISKGRPPMLTHAKRNTLAEYEECRILADLFYYDILLPEAIKPIPSEDVDDKNIYCDMKILDDMFEGICDFCHADIFYRYYHCSSCNYDICMACYSQGRSCTHVDQLVMAQGIIPFEQLVKVYTDFINTVNNKFKDFKRIPCRLKKDGSFHFDGKQYNLATLCRRLEKYRQRNKIFSNYFSCGHCHKVATLEELYNEEQLDIVDIFGHKPCKLLGSNRKLNMVWVCSNCIAGCDGGCAFPETREKPKVDELVYYMPPESDPRNMGGASDTCLNKTTYWPRKIVEQGSTLTGWSKDDLREQILGKFMDNLHPRTLKTELAYRHKVETLVDGMTNAVDHWLSMIVEEFTKPVVQGITIQPPKHMPGFSGCRKMIVDFDHVELEIPKGTNLVQQRSVHFENKDGKQYNDNVLTEDEDLFDAEEENDAQSIKRKIQVNDVDSVKRSKGNNTSMEEEQVI